MKRCACHGRRFCVWALLSTATFPLEHVLWERGPLAAVTHLLGL